MRALSEPPWLTGSVLPLSWAIRPTTKRRLRALAYDTPSVHDLLPTYPCLTPQPDGRTGRRPVEQEFVDAGAHPELTRDALSDRRQLDDTLNDPAFVLVALFALVGVSQPTLQSFAISEGQTTFVAAVDNVDWGGDGTVHFELPTPKWRRSRWPMGAPWSPSLRQLGPHGAVVGPHHWARHRVTSVRPQRGSLQSSSTEPHQRSSGRQSSLIALRLELA